MKRARRLKSEARTSSPSLPACPQGSAGGSMERKPSSPVSSSGDERKRAEEQRATQRSFRAPPQDRRCSALAALTPVCAQVCAVVCTFSSVVSAMAPPLSLSPVCGDLRSSPTFRISHSILVSSMLLRPNGHSCLSSRLLFSRTICRQTDTDTQTHTMRFVEIRQRNTQQRFYTVNFTSFTSSCTFSRFSTSSSDSFFFTLVGYTSNG